MAYGSVNADLMTTSDGVSSSGTYGFKNRIINGAMVIDQRNTGASVTIPATGGQYTLDRWAAGASQASKYSVQQNAGSVTAPAGFSKYLGVTSLSAYSLAAGDLFYIYQSIEGFNTADLNFGTANAQTITLSFWVRSSLAGTFGGSLRNDAANRFYPFSYTISSANTWEQKSVTIAGDTTGTWVGATNGSGLNVYFGLGVGSTYSGTAGSWTGSSFYSATGATSVVGTNGATFYITGVQLEKGSTATSFDYRPYGTELQLCQRYYERWTASSGSGEIVFVGQAISVSQVVAGPFCMKVTKRTTAPTITYSSNSHFQFTSATNSNNQTGSLDSSLVNANTFRLYGSSIATSPLVAGNATAVAVNTTSAYIEMSAEL